MKEGGAFTSSASMTWGINIDFKTRFLPNIFYDIAEGMSIAIHGSAAGIILGPIIIPLYQSWEEVDQSAKDAKWVSDRGLQFNFNLTSLLQ